MQQDFHGLHERFKAHFIFSAGSIERADMDEGHLVGARMLPCKMQTEVQQMIAQVTSG